MGLVEWLSIDFATLADQDFSVTPTLTVQNKDGDDVLLRSTIAGGGSLNIAAGRLVALGSVAGEQGLHFGLEEAIPTLAYTDTVFLLAERTAFTFGAQFAFNAVQFGGGSGNTPSGYSQRLYEQRVNSSGALETSLRVQTGTYPSFSAQTDTLNGQTPHQWLGLASIGRTGKTYYQASNADVPSPSAMTVHATRDRNAIPTANSRAYIYQNPANPGSSSTSWRRLVLFRVEPTL
ncbi:MAG: hypothetical protein AAFR76_01455 [Planctomycetota bacterium]